MRRSRRDPVIPLIFKLRPKIGVNHFLKNTVPGINSYIAALDPCQVYCVWIFFSGLEKMAFLTKKKLFVGNFKEGNELKL